MIGRPPQPSIHNHVSLGKDHGAIALLRLHQPALSTHRNIQELGDSLVSAFEKEPGPPLFPTPSYILGHGAAGFVDVGDGDFGMSDKGSIRPDNEDVWAPQFARLWTSPASQPSSYGPIPKHRVIYLMSCSTAASAVRDGVRRPVGRDLMQRIANIGNLRVYAWTGLIFVNTDGWKLEPGAAMVCCMPSDTSPAAAALLCPEHFWREPTQLKILLTQAARASAFVDQQPLVSMQTLGFAQGMEAEDVESISILSPRTGREYIFPPAVATQLFKFLFSSQPFSKDGQIVGAVTARCTVKYRSQPPLTVDLVADRLADTSAGSVFLVSPAITTYLTQIGVS